MNRKKPKDGDQSKIRVLYVEDDVDILKAMETLISYLGYDVYSISTGSKAIDLVKSDPERFDFVITDYKMPGINGLELARQVSSINPNIPIILGTGNMQMNEEKMKESIYDGFTNATDVADYLAKKGLPFRDAHRVVGELVAYCEVNNQLLDKMSLEEYKKFHDLFEADITEKAQIETCVRERKSYGGTGHSEVERQITNAESFIASLQK